VDELIKEAIKKVVHNQSLTLEEAAECMRHLLAQNVPPVQIGAFLSSLAVKGEAKQEVIGFLQALREQMIKIDQVDDVVDTCGTGGDMIGSFNTSTAAALLTSAAGAKVAKCGNRSSSSLCGSADLLEEAGIHIELPPDEARNWVEESGFAFLFTPYYHPSLRALAPLRKELGIPTALNLLGPLGNPMCPRNQVLGVAKRQLAPFYAEILLELGAKHSFVVHGLDGMDEISLSAPTEVYEIRDGKIEFFLLEPASLGLDYVTHDEIRGEDAKKNRKILLDLFDGEKNAVREITCVNAGAALVLAGLAENIREGFLLAEQAIDSGSAKDKLAELVRRSKQGKGVNDKHVHAR